MTVSTSDTGRPSERDTCVVLAGHHAVLYHQVVLRLALAGHAVTGVAAPDSAAAERAAKIAREVRDAGGVFHARSLGEAALASPALVILLGSGDFDSAHWRARRRVVVSCQAHADEPEVRRGASVLSYAPALEEDVIADLAERVVEVLAAPDAPHALRYGVHDDARYWREHERPGRPPERTLHDRDRVEVHSTVVGSGVFSRRAIARGERIFATWGVPIDHQTEHSVQIGWGRHLEPRYPVRLINHSCEPNAGVRTNEAGLPDFHALRDIAPGEQITFDYAMTEYTHDPREDASLEFSMTCLCGTPGCRGKLGYYSELPPERRLAYAGFVSDYLASSPAPVVPTLAEDGVVV